jgi:microcystin-dependent protein
MADLIPVAEVPAWVPQIHQRPAGEPLTGGPPDLAADQGFANVQAQQLARRTGWLRQQLTQMVGMVAPFAAVDPPAGWLACDGAMISRTDYANLFARIGTVFGAGNGATTFRLPDMRGEFIRGWDGGSGVDPARAFGSAQGDAIRNLIGQVTFLGALGSSETINAATTSGVLSAEPEVASGATQFDVSSSSGFRQVMKFNASTQVPTASENRPRNVALLYCILY